MVTKAFCTLYTARLSVDDTYSLVVSTVDTTSGAREVIGDVGRATLALLEKDNNVLGEAINKSNKSAITEQLNLTNKDRKERFSEIKATIKLNVKSRNQEKKTAANGLMIFIEPYLDVTTKHINTMTGIISDMLQKFNASDSLVTCSKTIGIYEFMNELGQVNATYSELYMKRNQELAEKLGTCSSDMKPIVAKDYDNFCTAIEQMANYTPSDAIIKLFNEMEELRKKYSPIANHPKDKNDSSPKSPDTEE